MNSLYDLPAPAKINLFLHMMGRRPDGYHLLQSVFLLIDWQDTLHLELRPTGAISREDLSQRLPEDDLCTRAAKALQNATGTRQGVHIRIEKSIPTQAGMGGGSSDAATCLLGLNRLWGLKLGRSQLRTIGLSLGADVPFFIGGHNAWVEGIGERLSPVTVPKARFLVIKPAAGLSTREIFEAPDLKRDTKAATITGFAADASAPFGFGCNDLQSVAVRICPEVGSVLAFLAQLGLQGRMTGSGSAVFAPLPGGLGSYPEANAPGALAQRRALEAQLVGHLVSQSVEQQWQYKFCESLGEHPLAHWASEA
jgi:4-diphosphocytidyl-2-C-methyl-D-erythritol kinase